jgi:hypothetical protein
MSVVVPPMSEITASVSPVRWAAPMRLAAGPDKIVSIGRSLTKSAETSDPSPRTTISGALMPRSTSVERVVVTSSSMIAINLALRIAVTARLGPFNFADSSWLQLTGRPVYERRNALTASSWAELRTLN